MSKIYKSNRACQARRRRKRQSKKVEVLEKLASAPGAARSLRGQYHIALEQRTKTLESSRKRSASWRKKLAMDIENGLPNALVKARRYKKAKEVHYLKRKKEGQVSTLKAQ